MDKSIITPVTTYDHVFNVDDFKTILKKVSGPVWEFGHTTYPKEDPRFRLCTPFWKVELQDDEFFAVHLLNKIERVTDNKYTLDHVYANGHTYGLDGTFHLDDYNSNSMTFLLYAMPKWKKEWGGYTSYQISETELYSVYPEPNKGVLHHGDCYHTSGPISRQYPGLRVTIAWKLTLK
tara:strand:+ start:2939 stop:3472 length:534 start_codon:yes stop_codon:yes gene_type:complete